MRTVSSLASLADLVANPNSILAGIKSLLLQLGLWRRMALRNPAGEHRVVNR